MARTTRLPATDALALLQSFVNTRRVYAGRDVIATPAELRAWLVRKGLLPDEAPVSDADHARAIVLRDSIRTLLLARGGGALDHATIVALNTISEQLPLRACFTTEGNGTLAPTGSGVSAALTRILAGVVSAMADGSWARLKACHAETCQWVFYDESRNRSRVWCAMQACGNRSKVRAYKRRQRTAGRTP
jgi:predicted RNA-binding Zn ribbon-like protein